MKDLGEGEKREWGFFFSFFLKKFIYIYIYIYIFVLPFYFLGRSKLNFF